MIEWVHEIFPAAAPLAVRLLFHLLCRFCRPGTVRGALLSKPGFVRGPDRPADGFHPAGDPPGCPAVDGAGGPDTPPQSDPARHLGFRGDPVRRHPGHPPDRVAVSRGRLVRLLCCAACAHGRQRHALHAGGGTGQVRPHPHLGHRRLGSGRTAGRRPAAALGSGLGFLDLCRGAVPAAHPGQPADLQPGACRAAFPSGCAQVAGRPQVAAVPFPGHGGRHRLFGHQQLSRRADEQPGRDQYADRGGPDGFDRIRAAHDVLLSPAAQPP